MTKIYDRKNPPTWLPMGASAGVDGKITYTESPLQGAFSSAGLELTAAFFSEMTWSQRQINAARLLVIGRPLLGFAQPQDSRVLAISHRAAH